MATVSSNQVAYHPLSYGDQNGRVFWYGGELYRGIAQRSSEFYRKLIGDGVVAALVQKGLLIGTSPANLKMEGYDLVLRHRAIPFVSYAFEWCALMIKAAALLTLDLELELSHLGLTLQDAHPWNVLFEGTRPCWVDFGSIVPARNTEVWRAYDEFCHLMLYPLLVMAEGHHRVARRMLVDSDEGMTEAEAVALTGQSRSRTVLERMGHTALSLGRVIVPRKLRGFLRHRNANRNVEADRPEFLRSLRDEVAGIRFRAPLHPSPGDNGCASERPESGGESAVERVLMDARPESLLEVNYGTPFHSLAAARRGVPVVAMSVNETHVTRLYETAQAESLPVLPLVMDFRCPSPAYGLCGQTAAAASERLVCDVAIALDCTHILGVRYRLNFDQMAKGLAMFCRQGALLNFVAGDHPATRAYLENGDFSWYTPANLKAALGRHFRMVEEISGSSGPIYWCRK